MSNITVASVTVVQGLSGIFNSTGLHAIILHYGYLAIFALMTLEAASLPIPSEIVLPIIGFLAEQGLINVVIAFFVAMIAGIIGMTIDYFIAYFIGKDVVYKHLSLFHVKRSTLDAFDKWFQKNGVFAVFSLRLVPVLRGLISLPAGFAKMPLKQFYFYSIMGTAIWDALLITFGYYALGSASISTIVVLMSALGIVMYVIYLLVMRKTRKI